MFQEKPEPNGKPAPDVWSSQASPKPAVGQRIAQKPAGKIPLKQLSPKQTEFVKSCQAAGIEPQIGFIGGGNMAQAIIKGLIASDLISEERVCVSDPFPAALEGAKELKVHTTTSNAELLSDFGGGIVVLAVKPDILPKVLSDSKELLQSAGMIVSVIAGATIETIQSQLDSANLSRPVPVVRVMPNTGAIVREAASVFCRGETVTDSQADLVKTLMETIGTIREAQEKHLDAVTGLSGSGPAYVYTIIDALSDGGVRMGLSRDLATQLAAQTLMGAAKMVLETGKHPGVLKNQVCSPGGTTIAGVTVLEDKGVRGSIIAAVRAATERATELGKK